MKTRAATASRVAALAFAMLWLALMQLARADAQGAPDPARGAELYLAFCGACHSLDDNGAGPRHRGVIGRRAGTQPGYEYSPALRASKLVWNRETLDRWLSDPSALVPGNKMVVQLAGSPGDRADIIAWLGVAASPP
jgi:cytochrome c